MKRDVEQFLKQSMVVLLMLRADCSLLALKPAHPSRFLPDTSIAHDLMVIIPTNRPGAMTITKTALGDTTWDESTATAMCLAFAPHDAISKRKLTQVDGAGTLKDLQRVYVSPSLGKAFPAGDFTDENGNTTTSGTIGLVMDYVSGSTTMFLDCAIQIGLQGN